MELEKLRSLSDEDLKVQGNTAAEQLFRIRFQKSLGNNEGIKNIRPLKLDIARSKTIARERTLAAEKRCIARGQACRPQPRAHAPPARKRRSNMADTQVLTPEATAEVAASRRNEKVGLVVSTKMQKTIVVEIEMRKAHPKYKRVMKSNKKFYAHDEQNSARVGDVVRIREARPLSKLKRWSLEEIVRRSSLAQLSDAAKIVTTPTNDAK